MSFIMRQVAHCDVCGHEWLTAKVPSHCAKCKSRKWNHGGVLLPVAAPQVIDPAIYEWAPSHDPKTCRTYKCGMCAAIKAG